MAFASLVAATPFVGAGPAAAQSVEAPARTVAGPTFELDRGRVDLQWKYDEDGALAADVTLRSPVLRIVRLTEDPEEEPLEVEEPPSDPGEVVREAVPFPVTIDRVEIHDGSVVFVDETVPGGELLRVHGLEVVIENFSTEREESNGLPTLLIARGHVGRAGDVAVFATINPWTEQLDFAGRAQIVGLRLDEIGGFIEEGLELGPADGTFSAFIEISVHENRIVGGVRPVLEDVEVVAVEPGFFDELRAGAADVAFDLFSDDVPGREAVVTNIPLRGEITDPEADLWATFVGVLRNAFIEALAIGFGRLS